VLAGAEGKVGANLKLYLSGETTIPTDINFTQPFVFSLSRCPVKSLSIAASVNEHCHIVDTNKYTDLEIKLHVPLARINITPCRDKRKDGLSAGGQD
jgi:hypothetical protein